MTDAGKAAGGDRAADDPGNAPVGTGGLAGLDGGSLAVEAASHGPAEEAPVDEADEAAERVRARSEKARRG
jgi:hypothetical protein